MLDFSLHGEEGKKKWHLIDMIRKMRKTRYRTEAGNLNAPVLINRLKKGKPVIQINIWLRVGTINIRMSLTR